MFYFNNLHVVTKKYIIYEASTINTGIYNLFKSNEYLSAITNTIINNLLDQYILTTTSSIINTVKAKENPKIKQINGKI